MVFAFSGVDASKGGYLPEFKNREMTINTNLASSFLSNENPNPTYLRHNTTI
ncbi:hypothetical protein GIY83_05425 [Flavobacterium sp. SLB02]|nr:hypothetical protein GIY83_05425 [Flavobacterium sp. SLB02]